MTKKLLLIGGVLNLLLAIFHLFFWKMFEWPQALMGLSLDNRAILQVANIHLILVLLLFAWISISFRNDLAESRLGKTVLVGISGFYGLRCINEILFWDMGTMESQVIMAVCLLIGAVYLFPLIRQKSSQLA